MKIYNLYNIFYVVQNTVSAYITKTGRSILRKRKLFNLFLKKSIEKSGFTLIEMAISVGLVATIMVSVALLLAQGIANQKETERLRLAVVLSQSKLSQLLTRPDLSPVSESGTIGNDNRMYRGYKYKIDITNEKIDLAKIAEKGSISFAPVEDKLPEDVTNASQSEKMGQGVTSQTGGLIDIMKIVVTILYPRGDGSEGEYSVMTFRKIK